jgi:hypothetical protein
MSRIAVEAHALRNPKGRNHASLNLFPAFSGALAN